MSMSGEWEEQIRAALGEIPCELVIRDVDIVLCGAGKVAKGDIAVHRGTIVGMLEHYEAQREMDGEGMYALPGFIDGHIHLESSMLTFCEFSKLAVPHGTTALVCDPHEIANVCGLSGIEELMREAASVPLSVFFTAPSCVPATPLETSGARLDASQLEPLIVRDEVVGLAELMNMAGAIHRDPEVMLKVRAARRVHKRVDGHCPLLSGKQLNAYMMAGPSSDHESTLPEEALEKLEKGMWVMIREGSVSKNMEEVLGGLLDAHVDMRRCMLVSDDRHPLDIRKRGYFEGVLTRAIEMGVEPVEAVAMVSLNPAQYFNLDGFGEIAVGKRADIVLTDGLEDISIQRVLVGGKEVASNGKMLADVPSYRFSPALRDTVRLPPLTESSFAVRTHAEDTTRVRVIGVLEDSLITESLRWELPVVDGEIREDVDADVLRIAVVHRHGKTDSIGLGFVRGFGLNGGTIGSTVAHDSHNLVLVGARKRDMLVAAQHLASVGGGFVAVRDGDVVASLQLELAGLMTTASSEEVSTGLDELHRVVAGWGCPLSSPFMTLSFMCLPPIPHLKLTDVGLVEDFSLVSLEVSSL
ncbi:adenine deaminase [Methermicoccus shengliensis]|uniref:Adenine deaminase n=1 Tax=Methermicoccus shengliensis TaxID=660064 RepID=A0A832VY04_9EURY|nr:adenine deaminase [Methermicoccus shengliensis]HIH70278.1 adenine deaminase [Methermicoccus shengliensis]